MNEHIRNQTFQALIQAAEEAYESNCRAAAEAILDKACRLYEATDARTGTYANMAKMLASEAAWEAGDVCMQTYGGFAMAEEYDVERKFREARLYRIAPISTNLILSFLAERELDLPRSY